MVQRDTLIRDIVKLGPDAIQILFSFGMGCIGCPASQNESIEEAAAAHGMDVDQIIMSLNNI